MNAKRRINSTGRKKIRHEHIDIRMVDAGTGHPQQATASVELSDFKFPNSALLSIEAYHRSSGMRFDCGTIGQPKIPDIFVLNEIDQAASILFRVKVVDADGEKGRILGSAERVHPATDDENPDRKSLFPVLFRSLGEQVWQVQINPGDRPKLIINREIPGIQHRLKTDAFLQGMLFPAAFRIVMEALAATFNDDDEDDESELPAWQLQWLKFCQEGLGIRDEPPSGDQEARYEWINTAVEKFCSLNGFMKAIRKQEEEAHDTASS